MLSMWASRLWLGFFVALAVWAPRARAQAVYGGIAGTVTDSSGAAVPEARLTITSLERKTVDTAISNASGFYLKDRMLPGAYAVEAARDGFKKSHAPSVMVYVDTQTKVDLELHPGPVTEASVTVEAQGQLLKTDRPDVATTLGAQEITDLPVLDRNFTRFLLLSPGTSQVPWQHASSENPQGSTHMVNGQHFGGTGYQLDGTENRDPILGIIVINPNLEAIAEAKISRGPATSGSTPRRSGLPGAPSVGRRWGPSAT